MSRTTFSKQYGGIVQKKTEHKAYMLFPKRVHPFSKAGAPFSA